MSDFLIIEGFDYYNTAGTGVGGVVSSQWVPSGDGEYDIVSPGRLGDGQCIRMGDITGGSQRILTRTLGEANATFSMGFACRCNTDANQHFLRLMNASSAAHIELRTLTYTDVQVYVGGVLLTTLLGVFTTTSTWVYMEVLGTIHPTAGHFELWLNNTKVYEFDGDTSNHASVHTIDRVSISCGNGAGSTNQFSFDDLYFNKTATRQGEMRIDYKPVSADTADKDFTASTGSNNYAVLDEVPVAVADYVTGSVVGNLDIYELADLSADTSEIRAVQTVVLADKTDAGAREFEVQGISGAASVDTVAVPTTTGRFYYGTPMEDDPNTTAPWTYSGFNAAKLGLEVTV